MNLSNYVEVYVDDDLSGHKSVSCVRDLIKGKLKAPDGGFKFDEVVGDLIEDGYKLKQSMVLEPKKNWLPVSIVYLFARD